VAAKSIQLAVKVVPGASFSAIVGWLGDELKLRIQAPPENGKANKAVLKLLASALGIPVKSLRIVRGQTSAHKIIELTGVSQLALVKAIGAPTLASVLPGPGRAD